jgi:hypothetical protein
MRKHTIVAAALAAALAGGIIAQPGVADASTGAEARRPRRAVDVEILAPERAEDVGIANSGFVVDLALTFPSLDAAGFSGVQLTGPGGHANIPPAPGAFGAGQDDKVPGLVVLLEDNAGGPGGNLAGVFNLTTVGDRDRNSATIHDTWLVGVPNFGTGPTTLTVAVVDDLDGNGVYDDAPNVVEDADGDGDVDRRDLQELGVASDIETVRFSINPDPA